MEKRSGERGKSTLKLTVRPSMQTRTKDEGSGPRFSRNFIREARGKLRTTVSALCVTKFFFAALCL